MSQPIPERNEAVGIRQGAPTWLPDDGDTERPVTNPAASGNLATSGRDDALRGDTVSADTGLGSSGRQSGAPTPGNRSPAAARPADDDGEDARDAG
jgi:hypothetical protein